MLSKNDDVNLLNLYETEFLNFCFSVVLIVSESKKKMETLAPSPWKTTESSLVKAIDKLSNLLIFEQELLDGFEKDFRLIQRGMARMHLMSKNVIEERELEDYGEEVRLLATQVEAVINAFILRKNSKQPSCSNIIKITCDSSRSCNKCFYLKKKFKTAQLQ